MLKTFKMINVKIRILRGLLEEAINNIDAGNSNHTEEELNEIIDDLTKLNRGIISNMHHYKEIIKGYNIATIPQGELLEAIKGFHEVFDYVEDHNKAAFWDAIREFHERLRGPHFDEVYATYQVCSMYHTKANGIVCRGEVFTVEDAKAIYDKHVRNINREITYWDVYVAVNAQYHDYVRLYQDWFPNLTEEQLDEKVIYSAINFWFKDEDAGTGKVWNYFKEI